MRVSYYSLGCKVNLYESVAIVNEFVDKGFTLVDFDEESDVYIINTCSVTSTSDSKSRKIIRQAIKRNPNAVVAVMGCFSQLKPEAVKEIEGVDIILGTSNRHLLYNLVMDELANRHTVNLVQNFREITNYEELKLNRYDNKSRGFVKIEDGCNNFCSYCTIPYARGKVRSRNPDEVIKEIQVLTDFGLREIVLTGINTGAYGKDLDNYSIAILLKRICEEVHNLGRLRISSIEVTEVTDDLLEVISTYKNHFCNHFHVPIQGGADNTLINMNRKYTIEEYKSCIRKIRNIFPDANITTDIMAGFCMESNEDFIDTIAFVKEMNYGEMHVFPYSKRPMTKAYNMTGHIDEITKRYRVNELLELNKTKALEYRKQFEGKIVEVVIEKIKGNVFYGHSSNYMEVQFYGKDKKVHEITRVLIEKADYPISYGRMI